MLTAEILDGGAVLSLTIDHPRGNVLDAALMAELGSALEHHRDARSLRLVVLSAAGKHFSFGASVEEHRREQAPAMLESFHRLARQVAGYPVPIAALVQGRCLGGAFELVLCCHFVFATHDAVFACPEIRLGVFPPVLAAIGAQRLGGPVAERLLLTGGDLHASDGAADGWITARVTRPDELRATALSWFADNLAPLSAFAVRQGVAAARAGSGLLDQMDGALAAAERQYLTEVLESHDGNEGIEAFLAKREPQWTHT